jgi:hypothetical protein
MTDEDFIEIGRKSMEELLSQFKVVNDPSFNHPYALAVPRVYPSLIAKGTNSLVFELPPENIRGEKKYVVGKGFKYTESPTYEGVPENELHLVGCSSGLTVDGYGLATTVYWLREMQLGVDVPPMKEFGKSFGRKYVHYTIMPDLREGGLYHVDELEDMLDKLSNGKELRELSAETCNVVLDKARKLGLVICPAGHGSEENVLPALEHMFLIQHDYRDGRLVLGDLNHLAIHEKGRQFGIKPAYLK